MTITIFRSEPFVHDAQRGREWQFRLMSGAVDEVYLRLTGFAHVERPSTRHKWRYVKRWDYMDERSYHSNLKRADIVVPDDVREEALGKVTIGFVIPQPEPGKP